MGARRSGSRQHLIAVLDGKRYLDLLTTLDTLVAGPPLREAASKKPAKVIAKAVRKGFKKVADLVGEALELPPGSERDLAMHDARKKAKRTHYAAEAATPALGDPAVDLVKSMKSLQTLLGDHQDSVMVRGALRELATEAHAAGENAFTYGCCTAARSSARRRWRRSCRGSGRRWRTRAPSEAYGSRPRPR